LSRLRTTLLMCAMVGCSSPPTDAESYRAALVSAESFDAAKQACAQIQVPQTLGDCQVTITERFERLDPADCNHVTDPVWLDECRFLLAERVGQTGDIKGALAICNQSRFRRHCSWHLLQDGVDATLELSAPEAEAVLEDFGRFEALKDAPFQFWRIRWREWAGHGKVADEADCTGLRHEQGCRDALARHVREMLNTLSRRDATAICALPAGRRVLNRGEPVWKLGPLTAEAERQWEQERCFRGDGSR
jgi:hypothetical protein